MGSRGKSGKKGDREFSIFLREGEPESESFLEEGGYRDRE